mgnify:CR=1 FL=1
MTETSCTTCGSKCRMIRKPCSLVDCRGGNHLTETYQPLPRPDLTKLRVFHDLIVNNDIDVAIMDFSGSEKIQELWHAIKEVLDEVEGI